MGKGASAPFLFSGTWVETKKKRFTDGSVVSKLPG